MFEIRKKDNDGFVPLYVTNDADPAIVEGLRAAFEESKPYEALGKNWRIVSFDLTYFSGGGVGANCLAEEIT